MRILVILLAALAANAYSETIYLGESITFSMDAATLDKNGNPLPVKPGYKIYETCVPAGSTVPVSKTYDLGIDVRTLLIKPLVTGSCDYYATAYNAQGESAKSAVIKIVTSPAPAAPAAPVLTFKKVP